MLHGELLRGFGDATELGGKGFSSKTNLAMLFPDMNRACIKDAEYFEQPQDYYDDDNDIEYLLDFRIHRNKPIDKIQAYAHCDENEYKLN